MDPSRPDEVGVLFTCPLLAAACIGDTIRNHDRNAGDGPTRVYIFRKTWTKVTSATVLSVVDKGGKVRLNPELFSPEKVALAPLSPPKPRRVF